MKKLTIKKNKDIHRLYSILFDPSHRPIIIYYPHTQDTIELLIADKKVFLFL